jgi:hypothetical protein
MSNEPYRLTATEAARQIAAGSLKPADLMAACLDRIAAREPVIHAFAFHDPSAVRAAARHPGRREGRAEHWGHAERLRLADLGCLAVAGGFGAGVLDPRHGRGLLLQDRDD